MEETERQLREEIATVGELVGSLTHDLKGLLTGLEGGIYMLDSGMKKGKQQRIDQGFQMLRRNLGRLRRTVAFSLYFVKDRQLASDAVEVEGVIALVRKSLADHAEHLGVTLELMAESCTLQGDELALHALLVDIIEYTMEACAGSHTPKISVTARPEQERVVFDIEASGFCISDDALSQIRTRRYMPIGGDRAHLGQVIASKLIEMLGGELEITRRPEVEATHFRVRI